MSLVNNIKNYLNFSMQSNFDADTEKDQKVEDKVETKVKENLPKTSIEAAMKSGYHGNIENVDSIKKPEVKETPKNQEIQLANVDVKAEPKDDKYGKFIAEYDSLKAEPTPNPKDKYNKFVAERGTLAAKATVKDKPKSTNKAEPWDKNDEATGYSWKNGAGQTVKLYRDSKGNQYIRGPKGKVAIFDAQGNVLPSAKNYKKLTNAFAAMIKKDTDSNKSETAETSKSSSGAVASLDGMKNAFDANGNRMYPKDMKLER